MAFAWFSSKVEKRSSRIEGWGLWAIENIAMGETVVVKGGHVMTRQQRDQVAKALGPSEIQIGENLFIGPTEPSERENAMMYLNHSCDPNLGIRGEITFCAMRDIASGEEITFDYATGDDDEWTMVCRCGAVDCRETVSGKDWRLRHVQEKYRGWFSAYLQARIDG